MLGIVRWGIKWGFSAFISGLLVYNYLILDLPGASLLMPTTASTLGMGLSVFIGSLIGWFLTYLYQRFFSS